MFGQGFRPFFGLAALIAATAIPLWLWLLDNGSTSLLSETMVLAPRDWHVHEMLFGYGLAVLAGFLLTAIPNWTSRPPIAGTLLKGLVALWISGRIALLFLHDLPTLALLITLAFPFSLCLLCWREITAAGNRRNLPVCVALTVFCGANVLFLSAAIASAPASATSSAMALTGHAALIGWGERAGMTCLLLLITLIGGRVVPAFSRNWMKAQGMTQLPAEFSPIDVAALLAGAVALCAFVAMPHDDVTGWLFAVAAACHALRLVRWRGWQAVREPLVLILHLGYAWLAVGFALAAMSILGLSLPSTTAIHALTAGAIGTMTLAIMTRATLGHSGRPLSASKATSLIYVLVITGALLRITAPWMPIDYLSALTLAGVAWSGAFVIFAFAYGPMFINVPDKTPPQEH